MEDLEKILPTAHNFVGSIMLYYLINLINLSLSQKSFLKLVRKILLRKHIFHRKKNL